MDLPSGFVAKDDGATANAAPVREEAGEGLRRALLREGADRDRQLGLGIGSEVARAAEPAVRGVGAPDGWAIFDVDVDGQGHTTSVVQRQSDVAGFALAEAAIREALSRRTLKLPAAYRGARVRIKIVSRIRLPNGQEHQIELVKPFASDDEPGKEAPPTTTPKHTRWWEDLAPKSDTRMLRPKEPGLGDAPLKPGDISLPLFKWDPSNLATNKVFTVGVTVMDVIPR